MAAARYMHRGDCLGSCCRNRCIDWPCEGWACMRRNTWHCVVIRQGSHPCVLSAWAVLRVRAHVQKLMIFCKCAQTRQNTL
eukprot:6684983-Alexandrium_andersonii.AAC.1